MRGVIGVQCLQGQAGICATIDEEGLHARLPAEHHCRCCVVDRELCERQLCVPVVLNAVGTRLQRVADNSGDPFHLGVGILLVRRADDEARVHAFHEGPENLARELGVVIHNEYVKEPGSWAETHVADDLCRARCSSVALVGTACTLPKRRFT